MFVHSVLGSIACISSKNDTVSFYRVNHEHNKHLINYHICAYPCSLFAFTVGAFDSRIIDTESVVHDDCNPPCYTVEDARINFHLSFDEYSDYVEFCKFCSITPVDCVEA